MNYQQVYDTLIQMSNVSYDMSFEMGELGNWYLGRMHGYDHAAELVAKLAADHDKPVKIAFTKFDMDVEAARREEALAEAFSKTREVWDE